MSHPPCRTLKDVEDQVANGFGNPHWQIEVLCAEIRNLQRELAKLRPIAPKPAAQSPVVSVFGAVTPTAVADDEI